MEKMFNRTVVAFLLGAIFILGLGAALTDNRDTPARSGSVIQLTVKDAVTIFAGSMVAVDTNGEALPAADTANLKVVGRAEQKVDNTDDGKTVNVRRGIFQYANGDSVDDSDIGSLAYASDDQTVTQGTNVNSVVAGRIVDVDSGGVWVDTRLAF